MSTEKSKTNESKKFSHYFTNKLNTNKNIALVNLSIYYAWKKLNLHIPTINLTYLLQLGTMNLISLMNHILYLIIYKIYLNT